MPKYDKNTQRSIDYMVEHLKPLEGATITHVGVAVENFGSDDNPWWEVIPVLTVETPLGSQYQVAVLQDPEGNGPGWIDINEIA